MQYINDNYYHYYYLSQETFVLRRDKRRAYNPTIALKQLGNDFPRAVFAETLQDVLLMTTASTSTLHIHNNNYYYNYLLDHLGIYVARYCCSAGGQYKLFTSSRPTRNTNNVINE